MLDNVATIFLASALVILLVTSGIALALIVRRDRERRRTEQLAAATQRIWRLISPLYETGAGLETTVQVLRAARSGPDRMAVEEVVLGQNGTPERRAITSELAQRVGWEREWVDTLRCRIGAVNGVRAGVLAALGDSYRGPIGVARLRLRLRANFIRRCLAAESLAKIGTPAGLSALVAATGDPHPDVREVSVRHLGELAEPVTLPLLVDELMASVGGHNGISVRKAKAALVEMPLEAIDVLTPALTHADARLRFYATDVVRDIADRRARSELLNKNDFSPDLYRLFVDQLCRDDSADVRARAALVIRHFRDQPGRAALRELIDDAVWYVRLHACRAVGSRFYESLARPVAQRVTDSHWLVREAAVRSLRQMGEPGTDLMCRTFLTLEDAYATEQICEELQRSGMLLELLTGLEDQTRRQRAASVVRKMVESGKVTTPIGLLTTSASVDQRLLVLSELQAVERPEVTEALQYSVEADPDARVREMALAALDRQGSSTAVAGEGS